MPKRNINALVKGASSDIQPQQPLVRGRGLDGLISEGMREYPVSQEPVETTSPQADNLTSPQADNLTSPQADNLTSPQADNLTSPQADNLTSPQADRPAMARTVKSFRLRDDLSHRVEVLAAQERRKIYEIVEEALAEYLTRHAG